MLTLSAVLHFYLVFDKYKGWTCFCVLGIGIIFCVKNKIKGSNSLGMLTLVFLRRIYFEQKQCLQALRRRPRRCEQRWSSGENCYGEIIEDVSICVGDLWQAIYSNVLSIKRIPAKFAPKQLNFDQKDRRLAKNSITILLQASFSPDLVPCDFSLFPNLERFMKWWR